MLPGRAVGDRRESAQVGVPEDGGNDVHRAAPDIAAENPLSDRRSHVGVEDVDGDLTGERHAEGQREAGLEAVQDGDVGVGKPALPVARPRRDEAAAAALDPRQIEGDDAGEVIGGALRAKFVQYGKIEHRVGALEPPPQREFRLLQHGVMGPPPPLFGVRLLRGERSAADPLAAPPGVGDGVDAGVQRAHADKRPPQREAGPRDALAEPADQGFEVGLQQALLDQPVADGLDIGAVDPSDCQRRRRVLVSCGHNVPWAVAVAGVAPLPSTCALAPLSSMPFDAERGRPRPAKAKGR